MESVPSSFLKKKKELIPGIRYLVLRFRQHGLRTFPFLHNFSGIKLLRFKIFVEGFRQNKSFLK